MEATATPTPTTPLADISRTMVGLYKQQFGRGPTRARSAFAGPDTLVCVLEDSMTPAERNLVAMGEEQRMRDVRLFFQYSSEDEFIGAVEETFQRKVRGFISGIDVRKDISTEVFHLEPLSDDSVESVPASLTPPVPHEVFREANQRAAGWEERREDAQDTDLYHCECSSPGCREKVSLSRPEYDRIRANSTHFLVRPGHEVPGVEIVIGEQDGCVVIAKHQETNGTVGTDLPG